jgi:tRNA (mo5U34)-methyltransferase
MDKSEEQAQIDAISWYHEFDFGNGLTARSRVPDVELHRTLWRSIEQQLSAVDFQDKTVLDIGCWDGYWSFYAERRGAKHVLAMDDCGQNWSDGRGLRLAKRLYGSAVEINQGLSVYELASLKRKFDVIFFFGVYYHLFDPFLAFAQIRHCCHAGSRVLTEGSAVTGPPVKAAIFDIFNSRFTPTTEALRYLLKAAYFSVASEVALDESTGRKRWEWRFRMCVRLCARVLRGDHSGMAALALKSMSVRRVFLRCIPLDGVNDVHPYRPPFGLDVYDSRYRAESSAIS